MRRHVLRLGIAALAGGSLLAFGAPAQAAQLPAGTAGQWFASVAWIWEWADVVDGGSMASILSRTWS